MPIATRIHRIDLLKWSDVGADGLANTRYTRLKSDASDGRYWAAIEAVNARESNIAAQMQTEVTYEFEVSRAVGRLLSTNDALRYQGVVFKILGLKPVEQMGERFVVVSALEVGDEVYNNIVEDVFTGTDGGSAWLGGAYTGGAYGGGAWL
jgi:head-tail adaptor